MRTSEHIDKLAEALALAQGEFTNPKKDREVEVQPRKRDDGTWPPKYKFKYATLDAIVDTVRPVLSKHGLAFLQTPSFENGQVCVTSRLVHKSGEWVEEFLSATPENRNLQAMGTVISYLRRYSMSSILGIASESDDDGNAGDGNTIESEKDRPKTPTRAPVSVQRGSDRPVPTPAPTQAPQASNPEDDDWPIWISGFKDEFKQQNDYLAGRSYWEGHKTVLDNLKEKRPDLFEELSAWLKIESQKLPKAGG